MKDIKTIETLLEVAESFNYHRMQLNDLKIRQLKYNSQGLFLDGVEHKKDVKIYNRLLIILEKKYNKLLKQLNDEA